MNMRARIDRVSQDAGAPAPCAQRAPAGATAARATATGWSRRRSIDPRGGFARRRADQRLGRRRDDRRRPSSRTCGTSSSFTSAKTERSNARFAGSAKAAWGWSSRMKPSSIAPPSNKRCSCAKSLAALTAPRNSAMSLRQPVPGLPRGRDDEAAGRSVIRSIWSGVLHVNRAKAPMRVRNISATGAMVQCKSPMPTREPRPCSSSARRVGVRDSRMGSR